MAPQWQPPVIGMGLLLLKAKHDVRLRDARDVVQRANRHRVKSGRRWQEIRDRRLRRYADLRTALSTSVLPSDQIAPGTLWLAAMTSSNDFSIQRQSSSVTVSVGNSLMVWLAWPAT